MSLWGKAPIQLMYRHLNICASECYDWFTDTVVVLRHIHEVATLQKKSPVEFEFSESDHWYLVLLLNCDSFGNYASDGVLPGRIKLIEVISQTESVEADQFASTVAERLGWIIIDASH